MDGPNFRHELKYPITSAQMAVLQNRISGAVPLDSHVGPNGKYTITSLYFDDYYNRCYYENENGTDPREKFRIRIYNHSKERISLELKRKERGKTLKKSTMLTEEETRLIMAGITPEKRQENPALLNKFLLEKETHLLHPVIIVEYERFPYVYKDGNVRITFDTNMASSDFTQSFLDGGYPLRPIMPNGLSLLEVKYDEFIPDFIYNLLSLDNLRQTAYSKYYLCRKFNLK